MGFLDKLFKGKGDASVPKGPTGALARLQKKLTNKYGQPQDRQQALRAVADIGTEEAVAILLKRYTFRIEQSIGDEEEKQMVFDELVRLGPVAVQPILEFLDKENASYWPLKALREIVGDEEAVDHLLDIIDRAEAIFDRDIQRKVELVSNLREFKDPRVRERLLEFLDDENEELRVQAVEGLMELGQEEVADVMVDRLVDEGETQRLKTAILNLLIEKKWKVRQRKEEVRKVIPQAFWIDDTGVIRRR
ncbi:MAG: HEAT repeat domain-containing protein [Deltaproteobacteria bacterium]|nr:HEAT repeat domain-containing protein [Deltaproteobacteria bacterium]